MIYLASPYSHPDEGFRIARFQRVRSAVAAMMREGIIVYSPIVHGHAVAIAHDLPTDFDFWKRHCLDMLRRADTLAVLMLDGWTESRGVKAEIDWWKEAGRPEPIFHLAGGPF